MNISQTYQTLQPPNLPDASGTENQTAAAHNWEPHIQLHKKYQILLKEYFTDASRTPFKKACQKGDLEKVILYLKIGINPNIYHTPFSPPLHTAIECGQVEIVRALLQSPLLKINHYNSFGNTPLLSACDVDHPSKEIIRLLLQHPDIDPNAKARNPANLQEQDISPLQLLCSKGAVDAISLCLDHPKTKLAIVPTPSTFLGLAVRSNNPEALSAILSHPRFPLDQFKEYYYPWARTMLSIQLSHLSSLQSTSLDPTHLDELTPNLLFLLFYPLAIEVDHKLSNAQAMIYQFILGPASNIPEHSVFGRVCSRLFASIPEMNAQKIFIKNSFTSLRLGRIILDENGYSGIRIVPKWKELQNSVSKTLLAQGSKTLALTSLYSQHYLMARQDLIEKNKKTQQFVHILAQLPTELQQLLIMRFYMQAKDRWWIPDSELVKSMKSLLQR
jgi:ankyrin repeat protein